ncbi:MAG: hypothetical protein ISS69_10175 [Phycisphaerae bacterium]|nr:hypothetical protein [Planctomycetota bacterium]MBL7220469.1 hypothetical protein [Phycisphaerae bacterium]
MNLIEIVTLLNTHHQRATYGAVGDVVGLPAQSVGQQLGPRNHLNSWVVNARRGLPTGYAQNEMHPNLLDNAQILASGEDLQAWINQHQK